MRKTKTIKTQIDYPNVLNDLNNPMLRDWIVEQAARSSDRVYLLAHCLDGVIWGKIEDGQIFTSREAGHTDAPQLEADRLQQARLFNESFETLLWRVDHSWQSRTIYDNQGQACEYYDENQLLWGTEADELDDSFSLLTEGSQGQQHAIPFQVTQTLSDTKRGKLVVRHYLADEAFARVTRSRLVTVMQP